MVSVGKARCCMLLILIKPMDLVPCFIEKKLNASVICLRCAISSQRLNCKLMKHDTSSVQGHIARTIHFSLCKTVNKHFCLLLSTYRYVGWTP